MEVLSSKEKSKIKKKIESLESKLKKNESIRDDIRHELYHLEDILKYDVYKKTLDDAQSLVGTYLLVERKYKNGDKSYDIGLVTSVTRDSNQDDMRIWFDGYYYAIYKNTVQVNHSKCHDVFVPFEVYGQLSDVNQCQCDDITYIHFNMSKDDYQKKFDELNKFAEKSMKQLLQQND